MKQRGGFIAIAAIVMVTLATGVNASQAASAAEISSSARTALNKLYASHPAAKTLGQKAKGILVFPSIPKAGLIVGGQGLGYLDKSGGWELRSGPSLVVVDEGLAKSISSTTLTQDVYAYIFNQKGLMGGLGIQRSKITRIHPK